MQNVSLYQGACPRPNMSKESGLEPSWREALKDELAKPYIKTIQTFVNKEKGKTTICPPPAQIFAAFKETPFDKVKVVILGQDPYHTPGIAHGLAFSVNKGIKIPPSLKNILREIQDDLGIPLANHGCLSNWAKQGVFLLNTILTVKTHSALSHKDVGWQQFTEAAIHKLSTDKENLVFLLWGANARKNKVLIDSSKHLILECPHPSPFSASSGFFGCKHFSTANEYLLSKDKAPIDWYLGE